MERRIKNPIEALKASHSFLFTAYGGLRLQARAVKETVENAVYPIEERTRDARLLYNSADSLFRYRQDNDKSLAIAEYQPGRFSSHGGFMKVEKDGDELDDMTVTFQNGLGEAITFVGRPKEVRASRLVTRLTFQRSQAWDGRFNEPPFEAWQKIDLEVYQGIRGMSHEALSQMVAEGQGQRFLEPGNPMPAGERRLSRGDVGVFRELILNTHPI